MTLLKTVSLFLIGSVSALAGSISLVNPSFETAPVGGALVNPGDMGAQGDVPGWGTWGSLAYEIRPTPAMFAGGLPDGGQQAALMYQIGGVDQNTTSTLTAGVTYSYSVYVGLAAGDTPLPWGLTIYANGTASVAYTQGDPGLLKQGGWILSTVSFTPLPGDPHIGQSFYLQFGVGNVAGADPYAHLFMDDVSATAIDPSSGAPEPSGLAAAGLAALVTFQAWRRCRGR